MKEALDKRENDSDLLVIIIRSARRNDNIFGIHDPPYCDLLPISCRSRRSPILWLSTSGYGWPFAIRLLPSRGSALHQRHLWDCEHVYQKKKQIFRFRSSIRLRQKQNNSVKEKKNVVRRKSASVSESRQPNVERRIKIPIPLIIHIYTHVVEQVIKLEGASFRSKPYRFGVQNGGYVVLETEWSSFINPWTKKLEFVVGQHRVLKGPANPDIFRLPCATEYGQLANISEEVLKEAKIIQGEIRTLLDEVCLLSMIHAAPVI